MDKQSSEAVAVFYDWLFDCIENGPPDEAELAVLEADSEYRFLIEAIDTRVDFIAITYERLMLIKRII